VRLLAVDPARPDPAALREAARILRSGGLVAFPTETVYGLGAHALDPDAVLRIFAAKGRPTYNPLIAHVADAALARRLASSWPEEAVRLARAFWPGPLTLVVPKRPEVPDVTTAGLPTVALRVPAHPVAAALLEAAGLPVAAPSANRFTELSPTTAAHVAKGLGERVDLILDGGPTRLGIESTVLDLSGPEPLLLRPGSIPLERLAEAAGRPVAVARPIQGSQARPSPGMLERHYAPRARLLLFPRAERDRLAEVAGRAVAGGLRVGALLLAPLEREVPHVVAMPDDPEAYARLLYAALHDLDALGCDLVLVDAPPPSAAWAGVRDRLTRAAHAG
jgi:L-threonylcarbamoyladenylate synthase